MAKIVEHSARYFVVDSDERTIGAGYDTRFEAEVALARLAHSSARLDAILSDIRIERARQDATIPMHGQPDGTFAAATMKKLGDACSTLLTLHRNKRNIRQELIESAAVICAWLEELELRDSR